MTHDLPKIARDVRRSLMVTAFLEKETVKDGQAVFQHARISDQERRVMALINELTFQEGWEGVWVESREKLAQALSMDKSDCALALRELKKFKVIEIQERDGGWLWIEPRAARLAVTGRALQARAAMEEIELAHRERMQQPELAGIERSVLQGRGFGFDAALGEVRGEEDRVAVAEGRFPSGGVPGEGKVPSTAKGDSPRVGVLEGKVPSAAVANPVRAYARGDSADRQIGDSNESGAVAPGGSGGRFRDGEKNWIMGSLFDLDARGELKDETCRRTWVGRVRDQPLAIREAIGEVKEEKARGKVITSPLGRVFSKAQSIARGMGKTLRMFITL